MNIYLRRYGGIIGFIIFIINTNIYCQNLLIKEYTSEEGLPTNITYESVQDSNGYLWLTSAKGIFSYDAKEWKMLNIPGFIPGLESARFIRKDNRDNIWVFPLNYPNKIFRYDYKTWQEYAIEIDNRFSISDAIVETTDKDTTLYIAGNEGLYIINNRKVERFTSKNGLPFDKILTIDKYNDSIFLGLVYGSVIYKNGKIETFKIDGKKLPVDMILESYVDTTTTPNRLWFLGHKEIGFVQGNKVELYKSDFSLPSVTQLRNFFIAPVNENRTYFGSFYNIYWLNVRTKEIFPLKNRYNTIEHGANFAMVDREKNVWLTTQRGICKIPYTPFINYYTDSGLHENEVASLAYNSKGTLIVGHDMGYSYQKGTKFNSIPYTPPPTKFGLISRILDLEKCDNLLLSAASFNGLEIIDSQNRIKNIKPVYGLSINTIKQISNGDILLGTGRGLAKYVGGKIDYENDFNRQRRVPFYVRSIYEDNDSTLYICTKYSGVMRYKNNTLVQLKSEIPDENNVYNALRYRNQLYVATAAGLCIINKNKIEKSKVGIIIDEPCYNINEDSNGRIWFGTGNGVNIWDGKYLHFYSYQTGLAGTEINRHAFAEAPNGDIWLGTNAGLSRYDNGFEEFNFPNPKITIVAIEDFNGNSINDKIDDLPNSLNSIAFSYRGISFRDEEKLQYTVILNRLSTGTADTISTGETTLRFSTLPPGNYQLSVRVTANTGLRSKFISTDIIKINKPFYFQWWFYSSVSAVLLYFLYLAVLLYYRKRYSTKLELEVKSRTKDLEKSETRFRKLIETANDGIISGDANFNIVTWNKAAERIYGYTAEEVIGRNYFEIINSENSAQVMETNKLEFIKNRYWEGEVKHRNNKGERLVISLSATYILDNQSNSLGTLAICRDITGFRQFDQNMANAIVDTMENERARISRDLHDDLGQILTSAKMKLELFEYLTKLKDENFNEAIDLIEHAGKELRNIVHDLHPAELEKYGLIAAIDLYIYKLQRLNNIHFSFKDQVYNNSISKKKELMIYRIVQEGLNNIVKHSHANEAIVSILDKNETIEVKISDNGVGFNQKNIKLNKENIDGYGLLNIYQRAELLGAEIDIISQPGIGTELILKLKYS